jgi:hypothetical protein
MLLLLGKQGYCIEAENTRYSRAWIRCGRVVGDGPGQLRELPRVAAKDVPIRRLVEEFGSTAGVRNHPGRQARASFHTGRRQLD